MVTFSNYYGIGILLLFLKINISEADISEINDLASYDNDDDAVSNEVDDDVYDNSGLDIIYNDDVCKLPIVIGECRHNSRNTVYSDIERFSSYNTSSRKCEEFVYDGCGNEGNRFLSINKCWKTCFTPLSYFLAKVKERLKYRFNALHLSRAFRRYLHFENDEI